MNPIKLFWVLFAALVVMLFVLFKGEAHSTEIEIEELNGQPFARISVINKCGQSDVTHTEFDTVYGLIIIEARDTDGSCGEVPDIYTVITLPPGIIAKPMKLELTEKPKDNFGRSAPSEPGFIELYSAMF